MSRNKIVLVSSLLILGAVGSYFGYRYYQELDAATVYVQEKANEASELEKLNDSLLRRPTLDACVQLLGRYVFVAISGTSTAQLDKAIDVGNQCVQLGANEAPQGWLVNFWLARLFYRKGETELAKKYLSAATALDKNGIIARDNMVEVAGMASLK